MDKITSYRKALRAAEQVLAENPQDPTAHLNQGVVLSKLGRYEEAVESFNNAIRYKPNFARAYYNMGLTLRLTGRMPEAINAFDSAAMHKPNIPIIYDKRSAALIDLGAMLKLDYTRSLFEAAMRDAEKAIELSTEGEGHYNMACALSRLGRYPEALEHLAKAKGAKGIDFDANHALKDPDLAGLHTVKWVGKLEKILGPKKDEPDAW